MKSLALITFIFCFLKFAASQNIELVSDINQFAFYFDGNVNNVVEYNGKIYFTARSGVSSNFELYVCDGTNPPLLVDPNGPTDPWGLMAFNGKLYFRGTGLTAGQELWVYDDVNPPQIVADINVSGNSGAVPIGVFNGFLWFRANDGVSGMELWKYDGIAPPVLAFDIESGTNGSNPDQMIEFNSEAVFVAYTSTSGYEMFKFDGTNSPVMVGDINPGASSGFPTSLIEYNGKIYCNAKVPSTGYELWEYDGVNAPVLALDIASGSLHSNPSDFHVALGKLYFRADDGINGSELWSINTSGNIILDQDLVPSSSDGLLGGIFSLNGNLFFSGFDVNGDIKIYTYDGINQPTIVCNSILYEPSGNAVVNNKLFFRGMDQRMDRELFVFDGLNTPYMFADIWPGNESGLEYFYNPVFDSILIYAAKTEEFGEEVWITNSNDSTYLLIDIEPGNDDSNPQNFVELNNKVYFTAGTSLNGFELYSYDGINPPILAHEFVPGPLGFISTMMSFNSKLYIVAQNSGLQFKLWEWDGVNIPIELADASGQFLVELDGNIFFLGNDITNGSELWKFDGVNTPSLAFDMTPGVTNSNFYYAKKIDSLIYFTFSDGVRGMEMWKFNGIDMPAMIADIDTSLNSNSWPAFYTKYGNNIYFKAQETVDGIGGYRYDGVNAPVRFSSSHFGPNDSFSPLGIYRNLLISSVDNGLTGIELYLMDEAENFFSLGDINPSGNFSSSFCYNFNGSSYFSGIDEIYGKELFKLTCNNSTVGSSVEIACNSYLALNGVTYFSDTIVDLHLLNAGGCDSTHTLTLEIAVIDTSVSQTGTTLNAVVGFIYQWMDCSDFSIISGETFQSFTPSISGTYAVIVDNGDCADTSLCHTISYASINNNENIKVAVFPNPTSSLIEFKYPNNIGFELRNLNGAILRKGTFTGSKKLDCSGLSSGVYLLHFRNLKHSEVVKLIIE